MTCKAFIELKGLKLKTQIGLYSASDIVPDSYLLDMTLSINSKYILIKHDGMQNVFDYDPLIAEIERLAGERHYDTQEYLITRIAQACVAHHEVESIDIVLRKAPLQNGSGSLGVRLFLEGESLRKFKSTAPLH
jgi:dihydroneopterin aldolase